MKIFKKIKAWLFQNDVDLAEGYKQQYHKTREKLEEVTREKSYLINELNRYASMLRKNERTISKLEDEINIQKSKAAKYLACYLEEMEKHAPND